MAEITGAWYHAQNAPVDDDSLVGGSEDLANPLTGLLSEIFPTARSRLLGRGVYERFRKVHYQNQGNSLSETVAFFQTLQHIDQLTFAMEKVAGDTSTDAQTMPAGYTTSDFSAPIGLVGALDIQHLSEGQMGNVPATTGVLGFWLRQYIPEGLSPETGALAQVRIAGVVDP